MAMQTKEQRTSMTQTNEKEQATSRGIRRALVVMLLLMLGMVAFFIAYSHLPRAGTGNTVNDLVTPTAAMSHPVGTLTVGRSVDYAGLRMTVPLVEEAGGFSNDQKKSGPYTLRVH